MKKVLLLTLAIMICASMAFAQAGGIGLYLDNPGFSTCDYVDAAAALVPVYVVHVYNPGATASQFMAVNGGHGCTFTGEIMAVPVSIGSTQTGLSASYGACIGGNVLIATMNYFCMGAAPPCSYIEIVVDPAAPSGTIEIIDCSFVKQIGVGSKMYFNPDGTCGTCGLPTNESSWGQIKAIYGN